MAADVGTLQRLPKVIGNQSLVRELCLTARKMKSDEAAGQGLVSQVFSTHDAMIAHALDTAQLIASKSPVAVQATKKNLIYSQDHTTQEGLDQIVSEIRELFNMLYGDQLIYICNCVLSVRDEQAVAAERRLC